jgi:hypothetical protein
MTAQSARVWRLTRPIPDDTAVTPEHFVAAEEPLGALADGEVLVEADYLSLDPYVRGRLSPSRNYAQGVGAGDVVTGRIVGTVTASKAPDLPVGTAVFAESGWRTAAVLPAAEVKPLDTSRAAAKDWLGVLGLTGLTAWHGLFDVGRPEPGDTVLVTAAAGAVGSTVAQLARAHGCRVIGVAGGSDKTTLLRDRLGVDAAIDYRAKPDWPAALADAAPLGIDVFFDNVGGILHNAIMAHLAPRARVIICGVMAQYNPREDSRAGGYNLRNVLIPRATVQGFLVHDHATRFPLAQEALIDALRAGSLTPLETIVEGFEAIPQAFIGLLTGRHTGKAMVRLTG